MPSMPFLRFLAPLLILLALSAAPSRADEVACLTSINGERRPLVYDPDEPNVRANISMRERTFGGPKGIECPGFVTLTAILRDMTPEFTYAQTEPFCLIYDEARQTYTGVAVGKRNARLLCRTQGRSLCQRVNATKDAALSVAEFGTGVLRGVDTAATAAGVTAAATGSGAVVLSGPTAYIASALSSVSAGAMAVLTAPATLTATAVTVVVVGGAVYACAE
jgi:hypothetical protein